MDYNAIIKCVGCHFGVDKCNCLYSAVRKIDNKILQIDSRIEAIYELYCKERANKSDREKPSERIAFLEKQVEAQAGCILSLQESARSHNAQVKNLNDERDAWQKEYNAAEQRCRVAGRNCTYWKEIADRLECQNREIKNRCSMPGVCCLGA